jgi:hypothetical protein
MQVHQAVVTAGKVALGCLVVLALAVLAMVGTNVGLRMNAGSLRSAVMLPSTDEDLPSPPAPAEPSTPAATPAQIVAARFPFPAQTIASSAPPFQTASVMPAESKEAIDPAAETTTRTATMETPSWPASNGVALADPGTTETLETAKPEMVKPEPAKPRRPSARSPNVLNDAMIANVRHQLKLTPDQAQLWPPVEAALRKIVYTRTAMNSKGGVANIDPNSAEVSELKMAALPLLMRLSSDQKREVRQIAFLMGLESLASQF